MRKLFILFTVVAISILGCSQAQTSKVNPGSDQVKVLVYYFHGTHRCPGCIGGENATVKALYELYKDKMDDGIIRFASVNIDEQQNKTLAEKYQISWSSLLIVKQFKGKEEKVDLTEQSFAYGKSEPEKLKTIIQLTIDKMLN